MKDVVIQDGWLITKKKVYDIVKAYESAFNAFSWTLEKFYSDFDGVGVCKPMGWKNYVLEVDNWYRPEVEVLDLLALPAAEMIAAEISERLKIQVKIIVNALPPEGKQKHAKFVEDRAKAFNLFNAIREQQLKARYESGGSA